MLSDQLIGLAAEHRGDLLREADRRRLAARLPAASRLRDRLGAGLVSIGAALSGERGGPHVTQPDHLVRKEVGEWKPC